VHATASIKAEDADLLIHLPDEAATERLAEDLAAILQPGDLIGLSGGLGSGKTTFARALIRAFADNAALEVPSPTFTLVQTYADGRFPLAHFDLYRLSAEDELDEIGLDDAIADGAVLVEWPERASARLPAGGLELSFEIAGDARKLRIEGAEPIRARFIRSRAIRAFLERAGRQHATRRYLIGDASRRSYERIRDRERGAVLMDWPLQQAEAAVSDPRAAYRARDIRAVVAVDLALRDAGLSVPEPYAADVGAGLLLMEDFGSEGVVANGAPIADRYLTAVAALAEIHAHPRSRDLALPDGAVHRLPDYRSEALAAELDLFPDWYIPHVTGVPASTAARADFHAAWAPLLARLDRAETSWVLLDVHSPNLLWLADRWGIERIGFLDFQDAMIGPTAYDVASLAEDARVAIPPDLEQRIIEEYLGLRRSVRPDFDSGAFKEAYAILAAQRATKILGVFARLADRDGKTGYLAHMPRVREYLARSLALPVLSGLAVCYERHRFL
jgi:N-acetylmuramate 1-kinase